MSFPRERKDKPRAESMVIVAFRGKILGRVLPMYLHGSRGLVHRASRDYMRYYILLSVLFGRDGLDHGLEPLKEQLMTSS